MQPGRRRRRDAGPAARGECLPEHPGGGTGAWTDATGSRPVCGILVDHIDVSVDALATTMAAAVLATPSQKLATDSSGRVTVGSNADKTGYALTTAPPTAAENAAAILATPAQKLATDGSGRVTVGSNADKTGYALTTAPPTAAENAAAILATPAQKLATDGSGRVTVGASSDKSGYSLAADQSGVTVGTVNALGTQAKADVNAEADTALSDYDPPTNAEMDAGLDGLPTVAENATAVLATPANRLATDASGRVTVGANADKGGYALAEGHGLALAADLAVVDGNVDAIVGKLPLGALADSSEVTAIQNNTLAVRVVPPVMERPDSGSRPYRLELYLYDEAGHMEAPDSAPEVHVINQAGTSRDAQLDSTTMALVSTGHYRALYTVASNHDTEELVFTFTVVAGGSTRQYGNAALVADTTAVDFTASDRSDLQTIKADVTAVLADTGATGVVVETHTAGAKSEIKAQAASALSNYDPPTKAEVDAGLAGLHDLSPAEAQAAAAAALDGYDPPTKSEMDAGFAGLDDPSAAEIATAVVNIDLASYEAAAKNGAKLGNMVAAARAGALGRLELSGTMLTLYEVDGSTILARFTVAEDYSSRSAPS